MTVQTSVTARLRRSYNASLFDGLNLPPVVDFWVADGLWSVLFDGELTDADVFAAWARMESSDDTDEARRAAVSVVFQHPYLFDGSLRDNILVGDPSAALGFFARAEDIAPRNGRIKAGLA